MSDPFRTNGFSRMRQAWWRHKDSQVALGLAMATIAVFFIIGIVAAFNNARLDSMSKNSAPAVTASAPTTPRSQPETTGTSNVNQPALATPENTRP